MTYTIKIEITKELNPIEARRLYYMVIEAVADAGLRKHVDFGAELLKVQSKAISPCW